MSVSATVVWEDCDRPQQQVYIDADGRFVDHLSPNPNAFLLAAIIPAIRHRERRVQVDGTVCPRLRNGLVTVMQQLRKWYGEAGHRPVAIEATEGFAASLPHSVPRTASFLSGGVDSLVTLRCNRLDFPLHHPGSIRDCVLVHGFDLGGYEGLDRNIPNFNLAVASLTELAEEASATLIPVYTNLRYLEEKETNQFNNQLFTMESHGACLGAVVHAFSRRVTSALIASSFHIRELGPWGSHPLLDPNYSSSEIEIRHDGTRFSRLEKVGLLAEWEVALRTIRACLDPFRAGDALNCGKCEKCIRTMIELLTFGKLKQCPSFPADDVSPELIQSLRFTIDQAHESPYAVLHHGTTHFWKQLIDPLRNIGRHDLAEAVEAKLAEHEQFSAGAGGGGWKNRLKRFDRRYLGSNLSKLNRILRRKPASAR